MRNSLLAASILAIAGCSSHPDGSAETVSEGSVGSDEGPASAPGPFIGTWSCTETIAQTGASPQTSTSTLTIIEGANGQIVETASVDGGAPICTLAAAASGASALLFPGPCSISPGVTLNLTSGSEAVSGGTLTYAFVFTQTGDAGSGAGTVSAICAAGDAAPPSQDLTCSAQAADGGFLPFVPPSPHRSVCTPAQILAYYDACWAAGWTNATCDPFDGDPANSPCIRCMYGDATAKSWAAVIDYHGGTLTNIGGCIALVDGDSSPTGCGAAYQTFQQCLGTACNSCPTSTTYDQCVAVAEFGVCQTYAQATTCSQADEYSGCFFTDFESYFRGIGQLFCAAASSDAGGDGGDSTTDAVSDAPGDAMSE